MMQKADLQDVEKGGFRRTGVSGIATSRGLCCTGLTMGVWEGSKDKGREPPEP